MSTETEAKFYVRHLKAISERLENIGAKLIQPRLLETNLRFDLLDGSLRQQERLLRLRLDTAVRLTYKGPSKHIDGVLSREEIEVEVADLDITRRLLEALDYQVVATYEKYRRAYSLEILQKDLHISLDELPYGDFVEIEGETHDAITAAAIQLGLDPKAAIPASYLALFERLCAKRGLDASQLTFTALAGLSTEAEHLHVRAADT